MAIQMRRGMRKDFDPAKMLPGEWAVAIDNDTQNQIVWMCFAAGVVKRIGTYEDFLPEIERIHTETQEYAQSASESKQSAEESAKTARSYAVGDTNSREGEETDNAKEYAKQAKASADKAIAIAGGDYVSHTEVGKPGGVPSLGEDGVVPAEQLPKPKVIEQTLTADGWTGEQFPYLYTVDVPDLTETQMVYVSNAEKLTEDEIKAFADACITGHHQETGKVVLQAVTKPTTELRIVIEIGGETE